VQSTSMFDSLSLSDLPKRQSGILRHPSGTRPAIRILEEKGVRAIVKDFSPNKFFYRNTFGRFLIWRERKAYGKLRGIQGIPALYRTINGIALVVEMIEGSNLENLEKEMRLSTYFFDALKNLVDTFHKRGLAHCDLKRAPNILIGNDGRPYIVDWGASISQSELFFFPLNLVYRRFLLDDYLAIVKLKLRHIPEEVTPRERMRYHYRSWPEKLIRAARDRLRDTLQKIT
jgi:serine/threonine protein kinase